MAGTNCASASSRVSAFGIVGVANTVTALAICELGRLANFGDSRLLHRFVRRRLVYRRSLPVWQRQIGLDLHLGTFDDHAMGILFDEFPRSHAPSDVHFILGYVVDLELVDFDGGHLALFGWRRHAQRNRSFRKSDKCALDRLPLITLARFEPAAAHESLDGAGR